MTHVDWHPYPETRPDLYKPVLVTLSYSDGYEVVDIDELHFSKVLKKKEIWSFDRPDRKITAWAELPEPYSVENGTTDKLSELWEELQPILDESSNAFGNMKWEFSCSLEDDAHYDKLINDLDDLRSKIDLIIKGKQRI